ncbi:MAG: 5-formyltetrahydrofolate cyclo-ligase [Ornithinibacter sp.]
MATDPSKKQARSALRARRREIAARRDTGADSRALADRVEHLVGTLGLGPGQSVTSYAAVPGEPPTDELNARLAAHGIRVLLPVTEADLDLDWHDAADAAASRLGKDAIGEVALVLAPGLAVDTRRTRMGQGGGCYDKALPRRSAGVPVVVLLHPGELGEGPLPHEPHDAPVDLVLTADGLTDLRPGSH